MDYSESACMDPTKYTNPGNRPHANFFSSIVMEECKVEETWQTMLDKRRKSNLLMRRAGDYNARIHIG